MMDYVLYIIAGLSYGAATVELLTWLAERNPLPDDHFEGRELRHKSRRWRGMR